jgi:hypothetical protein
MNAVDEGEISSLRWECNLFVGRPGLAVARLTTSISCMALCDVVPYWKPNQATRSRNTT